MSEIQTDSNMSGKTWRVLDRTERRVLGVLVEKSKTTPDIYPMTLNAITTACNQKSNRYPLTNFNPDEVQDALDRLRSYQAVMEVHSDGRVPKFNHLLYEWLPIDKLELSVLAELLLRGQQTLGDLRARASRMDDIASQDDLRVILDSLVAKKLVVELTPPGRGQMVTHNLYRDEELNKIKEQVKSQGNGDGAEFSHRTSSTPAGVDESLSARVAALEAALASAEARIKALESAVFE